MELSVKKEPNGSMRSIVEHVWTMLTREISHVPQMFHVLVSNHWCICNHLIILFSMILQLPANTVHFYNTKIFLKWLVDCVWGDWKDESSCSKSCGHGLDTGVKHQVRVKIQNETHGGSCKGNSTRLKNCTTNIPCPSRFFRFSYHTYIFTFNQCTSYYIKYRR